MTGLRSCALLACLVAASACQPDGRHSPVSEAVARTDLHQVLDFAGSIAAARVTVAREWIGPGLPEHRDSLLDGWSRAEINKREEEPFSWVITDTASLFLDLTHTGYKTLHVRCWPYRYPDGPPQVLTVLVNGHALKPVELAGSLQTYTIKLPSQVLLHGRNLVELSFAYAESPRDHNPNSSDGRTLAAAVVRVGVGDPEAGAATGREQQRSPRKVQSTDGWDLEVPSEAMATYTTHLAEGAVLELGFTITGEAGAVVGEVVASSPDGSATTVFSTSDYQAAPKRWQIDLQHLHGQAADMTFVSRSSGAGNSRQGSVVWQQPRLLIADTSLDSTSNILLIVIDTLRADHLSCYGDRARTPNIDALARSGVLFEQTYCHIPITGPSHSSMMTSQLPAEHGVHNNGHVLDAGTTTLAQQLATSYRRTAAFISLGVLKSKFGLARGFHEFHEDFKLDWFIKAPQINEVVIPWLGQKDVEPFFLWVHYSDPHEPYSPIGIEYPQVDVLVDGKQVMRTTVDGHAIAVPLPIAGGGRSEVRFERVAGSPRQRPIGFSARRVVGARCRVETGEGFTIRERHIRDSSYDSMLPATLSITCEESRSEQAELRVMMRERLTEEQIREHYRLEVEGVDRAVGELLQRLEESGLRDRTLVILTSDHGESLGEHSHIGHISQLYEPLLRVPLIMSYPGRIPAGATVKEPVSHLDLAPTILDLLGLGIPEELQGRSLRPLINGSSPPPAQAPIVAETYKPESPADRQALIWEGFKYIVTQDKELRELYNLSDDPDELRSQTEIDQARTNKLHQMLQDHLAEIRKQQATKAELSEEDLDQLRALGYVH
jgi:arylsulfatase A-like enzyme